MLRLRRARPADGDAIHAVHASAVRAGYADHYAPADVEAWASALGAWSRAGATDERDVLVAEEAGRIVGFGALDVARAEVTAVYVGSDAARRGIGRRLLAGLEIIARLRGIADARLDASLNAISFYEAAGWHRERESTRSLPGGRDVACIAMTKTLPAARIAIRDETPADVAAVREVETLAFERAGEAALVDRLRVDGALTLSLVAVIDERLVGHVAFSPVDVAGATLLVLGLGPVGVRPELQRCAVGARLIEEGLARARERGAGATVVLGAPGYYTRFGYAPATRFGIRYPGPWPEEAFMAAELVPGALARAEGAARYHAAFGAS